MEAFLNIRGSLSGFQWANKELDACAFCDHRNFASIVFEDDAVIVEDNYRKAGRVHWLIIPKSPPSRHIRDIEELTIEDIPILEHMEAVKQALLKTHLPEVPSYAIHSGYHRGRRALGPILVPDIISVRHLHLHVIIGISILPRIFKYPAWFKLMWAPDQWVLRQVTEARGT